MAKRAFDKTDDGSLAMRYRVERICDQFEQGWKTSKRPRIEDFVADCTEPELSARLRELISLEIALRREMLHEDPQLEEYSSRFPNHTSILSDVLSVTRHSETMNWTRDGASSAFKLQGSASNPQKPLSQFGRYKFLRFLGKGGMGSVYLAEDPKLERHVAIKIPFSSGSINDSIVTRFHREAKAAAALRHPNICPIYEVGEIGGVHYLAMAYIEGQPLSSWEFERTIKDVLALVRKLALALDEAHKHGIIHRDLKPSNN